MDAADFGCRQKNHVRTFLRKQALRSRGIFQIKFGMGAHCEVGVALPLQLTHDSATGQSTMTGNVILLLLFITTLCYS
jgi:hypothetical protein